MESLKERGIDTTREQIILLKHLCTKDGLVQNDLAFISNRDKTSLTRLINKMEEKGLLTRLQCTEDNRCNKIFITAKGRELFESAFPVIEKTAFKLQENLNEEEIAFSIQILKKILNNISNCNYEQH